MTLDLHIDAHVHSTFSDGRNDPATNVEVAQRRGLHSLGLVDHVRADTTWLPEYVAAARRLNAESSLAVTCGIEAKFLDSSGRLDVPDSLAGVDVVVAADHQVPIESQLFPPARIGRMITDGEIQAAEVIENVLEATAAAAERYDRVLIAHLFSVLPKCGLSEDMVTDDQIRSLGQRLARADACVEVSERWTCPSIRAARLLRSANVDLVASTDSHRASTIGIYRHVADVAAALAPG